MIVEQMPSPVGELVLLEQNRRLIGLAFEHRLNRVRAGIERHRGAMTALVEGQCRARENLEAYFEGDLKAVTGVRWAIKGTAFQESVWTALLDIPVGQTWTYAGLAKALGRPKSIRAVANAVGANPLSIVLPCHRVVGSNGHLTGFGGGLERKSWLLRHEGVDV